MKQADSNPFSYTPVVWQWPFERLKARRTLVSVGSCFSESVAGTLLQSGFRGMQNPNGILYNPYSIHDAIQRLDIGYHLTDFFEYQGLWYSWAHHGGFAADTAEKSLAKVESTRRNFLKTLKRAECCMITVSSAVVYRYLPENKIVANCHKLPGNLFRREILSPETCRAALSAICRKIREWNPDCVIVFTVSPVCHYPGDLMLNSRSKAHLLEAVYQVVEQEAKTVYFPAYEIMTQELRDYRFYADDMLHPSKAAEKIILERFLDTCFEPGARSDYEAAEAQRRKSAHIVMKPQNDEQSEQREQS